MPVRPNEDPKSKEKEEGLSQNGEAEEEGGKVMDVEKKESEEEGEEMQEEEEEEEKEKEEKEGRASVGKKAPRSPTKAEREEHARTHCPYRSWCEHCVKSRARNSPHRKCGEEEPLE